MIQASLYKMPKHWDSFLSYCITEKEVNFHLSIQILYITQGWLKHSFSTTQQTFWVMLLARVITRCVDNCGILSRYRISNLFRTLYCLLPLSLTTRSSPLNPQDLNTCKWPKVLENAIKAWAPSSDQGSTTMCYDRVSKTFNGRVFEGSIINESISDCANVWGCCWI